MVIKRIISQRVLGYSDDFKRTHIEHVIETTLGEIKTVWSTDTETDIGIVQGTIKENKPYIARSI